MSFDMCKNADLEHKSSKFKTRKGNGLMNEVALLSDLNLKRFNFIWVTVKPSNPIL